MCAPTTYTTPALGYPGVIICTYVSISNPNTHSVYNGRPIYTLHDTVAITAAARSKPAPKKCYVILARSRPIDHIEFPRPTFYALSDASGRSQAVVIQQHLHGANDLSFVFHMQHSVYWATITAVDI